MSAWVPIFCAACGKVVGAAPAGKAPALSFCVPCAPAIVKTIVQSAVELVGEERAAKARVTG